MSIANNVVAEFLFGGPAPNSSHKTLLSAIRQCLDADNGKLIYFPEISIVYTFDDGSVAVVGGGTCSSYDSIDEGHPCANQRGEYMSTTYPIPSYTVQPLRDGIAVLKLLLGSIHPMSVTQIQDAYIVLSEHDNKTTYKTPHDLPAK